ncbi:hypothetical protein J1P26_25005 [Neobacillus sp. MM2021_6]|uniref:hypothetical protein n=1 Tax=Bacillaceae TaxID=186817 RepID=UPI00140D3DF5|nr:MULTISPECIES: hypothetical protein [Bacillaceae]MBO0962935.1 hypothetical protein [Neobacillus sp. MM2021_6]NHC21213.1 hypothetical protein [Bacillus sp. MM2020_4]
MSASTDLVIQNLTDQIANLSREKAIFFAIATEKEQENQQLRQAVEESKIRLQQVENELLIEKAKTAGPIPVKKEGEEE